MKEGKKSFSESADSSCSLLKILALLGTVTKVTKSVRNSGKKCVLVQQGQINIRRT